MMKIYRYGQTPLKDFFIRTVEKSGVADTVRSIIADVEQRGDEALFEYTRRFDGADLRTLEVSREEIDAAYERTDPVFLRVLEQAAENIREYHRREMPEGLAQKYRTPFSSFSKMSLRFGSRSAGQPYPAFSKRS